MLLALLAGAATGGAQFAELLDLQGGSEGAAQCQGDPECSSATLLQDAERSLKKRQTCHMKLR